MCVRACMLGYGCRGGQVSSRILEVLTFNLSSVSAITFSFVLVTVSKGIGYFIRLGAVLYKGYVVLFVSFKAKFI